MLQAWWNFGRWAIKTCGVLVAECSSHCCHPLSGQIGSILFAQRLILGKHITGARIFDFAHCVTKTGSNLLAECLATQWPKLGAFCPLSGLSLVASFLVSELLILSTQWAKLGAFWSLNNLIIQQAKLGAICLLNILVIQWAKLGVICLLSGFC